MTATQSPAATSWPEWLPRSLDYPQVPVGSILRAAVRRWGDRTAFLHHDIPLTFPELGRRAHAVECARSRAGPERAVADSGSNRSGRPRPGAPDRGVLRKGQPGSRDERLEQSAPHGLPKRLRLTQQPSLVDTHELVEPALRLVVE